MKNRCPVCNRLAPTTLDAMNKTRFRHHRNGHGENCLGTWFVVPPNTAVHLTPAADALSATDDTEPPAQVMADR